MARRRRRIRPSREESDGPRHVTDIIRDPRVPDYLVIEVDGARFASLPEEALGALELEAGQRLDEARHRELSHLADIEAVQHVAMRLLTARPRTVAEMRRTLRMRGHGPPAVDVVVERLEERGLLNDAEFARHFASVRSGKGHGPGRLITDLLAKGVEKRVAEQAVRETLEAEGVDPLVQARLLAERRMLQLAHVPADAQRRRLTAYLGRRGYRGYEVNEIVNQALREAAVGPDE